MEELRNDITECLEKVLDFCEVAIPPENYKRLRSKVLRLFNDLMRKYCPEECDD